MTKKIDVLLSEKLNITVNKMFLVQVDDYHEFDFIKHCLSQAGLHTDYEEINLGDDGYYYNALFWTKPKTPNVEQCIQLLEKENPE